MSRINSDTRFRKFNFVLYERLDTITDYLKNLFLKKTCKFKEIYFKFEPNNNSKDSNKYHAQGWAELRKQQRVGNYDSRTKNGSGIKKIFEANLHINHANGTKEECFAYIDKDFDRCKDPKHQPCKCNFKDQLDRCSKCNLEYKR